MKIEIEIRKDGLTGYQFKSDEKEVIHVHKCVEGRIMGTKFNFKSQICTTREQSERLLALGIKKETADMYYRTNWINAVAANDVIDLYEDDVIPAWSLHRLMCLVFNSGVTCVELHEDDDAYETLIYNIAWRIKEGYFNKEYYESR